MMEPMFVLYTYQAGATPQCHAYGGGQQAAQAAGEKLQQENPGLTFMVLPLEPLPPNPGSREARDQGCICPVMDNWRGSEELGRIRGFVVVVDCPLHGGERADDKGEKA